MSILHDFSLPDIRGAERSLGDYAGKVVLCVNVASKCGLTPQYRGLQALYERYRDRGFEVLGFPCNQFMGQEPGSESEIAEFCSTNYGVDFPMFSKIEVNGTGAHPLYQWLTAENAEPEGPGDVKWNFGKFLVDRDGRVAARFDPGTEPDADALAAAIEKALG
jgi:glutathione peroxidase